MLRKLIYNINISNYLNPKDIPNTEVKFMPLPGDPKPKEFNRENFINLTNRIAGTKFKPRGS